MMIHTYNLHTYVLLHTYIHTCIHAYILHHSELTLVNDKLSIY